MSENKHLLPQGALFACICIILFCSMLTLQYITQINNRNEAHTKEVKKILASYAAGVTDDEYSEIVQSIRHDLVLTEFSSDIEEFAKQIPNTADTCSLDLKESPIQAYITCTNTGEIYPLDLFSEDQTDYDKKNGHLSYGFDEISQSNIRIVKAPDLKKGSVTLYHGKNIVSIQRMKSVYCDNCIDKILEIVKNQQIKEFVIYDAQNQIFYGIDDGSKFQIGDYTLEIAFRDGNYEIEMTASPYSTKK